MSAIDFLVIGVAMPGGVTLYASKTMMEAELSVIAENPDDFSCDPRWATPTRREIAISGRARDYLSVYGANYRDAWDALFAMWSPEPTELRQLPTQRAIGS